MPTDQHGLALTTGSDAAARHFDEAINQYLGYKHEPGVRSHSAKRLPAGQLIANSARRRGEIAMPTAGSGPDSPSTAVFATLRVTASRHPGNLG